MNSEKESTKLLATKPYLFILPLIIGALLENFILTRLFPTRISLIIGALISLLSLPFIVLALREFYKAKILFDARRASTTLITTSIYKITRHPVYLSFVLFYIGLSFLINSFWMLVMVIPAIFSIQKFSIEREEKLLEAKYGEKFRNYKARVPRWI
jgi:protein-S-isoprenylcysteine O-methyltransferase Ste14